MSEQQDWIPYARQSVSPDDVAAVVAALTSDWLTTGPLVARFEEALAAQVGAREAVVVNSGTAALHAAVAAAGIGAGDEVVVPSLTFAASANAVVYQGGTPVFADVDPQTLLLTTDAVEAVRTPRTRAIVAVDYAGQPCDYVGLRALAQRHGLTLIADASHSLGGQDAGRAVGTLADLTTFSFHPVKPITTGEGGAITTDDPALARHMRSFRNHGITADHHQRQREGAWYYEIEEVGFNYRLTDLQCALGLSQLPRLDGWVERRQAIAARYDAALPAIEGVHPLAVRPEVAHAYHLYVVQLDPTCTPGRAQVFADLRSAGIGVNVHYVPVHLHPFYRNRFGTRPGQCPVVEAAYERILSLPMYPGLEDAQQDRVIATLAELVRAPRASEVAGS